MKPNIFDISTKELTQDAFITWLILWADSNTKNVSEVMNRCGRSFVTALIRKAIPEFNEQVVSVSAGRQWENIDVWATINEKYLLIIEDKTHSKQHSNQLSRYKKIADEWCQAQSPKYEPPICIYLKTGNESKHELKEVIKKDFSIFDRSDLITVLNEYETNNDIFNDFKDRLIRIEQSYNEWKEKKIKDWIGHDWQGFFMYLEKEIDLIGWNFVNNQSGGFWNMVLNWDYWSIYPVYIQTEEYKLCFKLSTDPAEVKMPSDTTRSIVRNAFSRLVLSSAEMKKLHSIRRPARFGSGKYMTVAVVDPENWLGNLDHQVDPVIVKNNLLKYKSFLHSLIRGAN